jgi:hypothetical protein
MEEDVVREKSYPERLAVDLVATTTVALICGFIGLAFVGETLAESIDAFYGNFLAVYAVRAVGALCMILWDSVED